MTQACDWAVEQALQARGVTNLFGGLLAAWALASRHKSEHRRRDKDHASATGK